MFAIKPSNHVSKRTIPGRSLIILLIFMACWCVLIFKLFELQIIDYDKYQNKVINNIQRYTTLKAERGEIYDSNMTKLASNYTVYRVFISPRDIQGTGKAELIAKGLSEILGVDYDKVLALTEKTHRADETVMKKATEEQADAVRKFILENGLKLQVHLEASSARYYPFSSLAANVIGVVGTDAGLSGIELEYDSFLRGESGKYITSKDAQGGQMPGKYDTYIDASNGANLVTTIDVTIQKALENQVKQAYLDSDPLNRVTGIVMDCDTGAILAMATYPTFDLNSPFELDTDSQVKLDNSGFEAGSAEYSKYRTELLYSLWRNKAVSELYEPGSTFKVLTSAMALDEGKVTPTEGFYCNGKYYVSGYPNAIHCHKTRGHGSITFVTGLQQSCNPMMMTISLRLGQNTFYKYFESFGFTSSTGIDLPGEASAIYSSLNNFNDVSLAVYSFGQTFKVTPLQQLTAINAVANGGKLLTPYVVDKIIDDDGNILMQHETIVKRQVISEETCRTLAEILEGGVSGTTGGAKNAYVAGYKIAAKTGTSEVRDQADPDGNYSYRVGSCAAFAPADDPQISVILLVDTPTSQSKYGSTVAAPYIAGLMDEILPYIGIERNYSEAELQKIKTTLNNYVGWPTADAVSATVNRGIEYEIRGDGDVITYQIPAKGQQIMKNSGKVIFYTGNATPVANKSVPDVVGQSAAAANRALAKNGFNVIIDGAANTSSSEAYVVSQSIAPGTLVTEGTVVTITVRFLDGTA